MYCKVHTRLAVIGVGNILMRDDGVGVHAIRELQKRETPDGVICVDGGTASFEALTAAGDCDNLLVVDAVKAGGKPGTIYKMSLEQWREVRGISLHDVTLLDAISIAQTFDKRSIRLNVIGIEPEDISPGMELSDAVNEKFNDLLAHVTEEMKG